jgi:phosphate transport system permease protein
MHAPATSALLENPFAKRRSHRETYEFIVRSVLRGATYLILFATAAIFLHIIVKGSPILFQAKAPFINVEFLTKLPETLHVLEDKQGHIYKTDPKGADAIKHQLGDNLRQEKTISYSGGGILGPIVGTFLLVLVCIVAGVPSVVFGLFGLGVFVLAAPVFTNTPLDRALLVIPLGFTQMSFQGWDTSVLSGAFTLAFVILPVIITASEECLRAVPMGFRETSLALGATRWQTIWRSVLPFAMPGILTSSILGIARAAGETAPIMFTAALAFKDKLPWQGEAGFGGVFTESVQALPYHIYTLAARIPQNEYSERAQYGSVFVFLVLVMTLATASVLLRRKLRAKYKW